MLPPSNLVRDAAAEPPLSTSLAAAVKLAGTAGAGGDFVAARGGQVGGADGAADGHLAEDADQRDGFFADLGW